MKGTVMRSLYLPLTCVKKIKQFYLQLFICFLEKSEQNYVQNVMRYYLSFTLV